LLDCFSAFIATSSSTPDSSAFTTTAPEALESAYTGALPLHTWPKM
jgi:hypothetical protein